MWIAFVAMEGEQFEATKTMPSMVVAASAIALSIEQAILQRSENLHRCNCLM
jgi:hypothetical protein